MQKLIFTNSRGQNVNIGNSAPFILKSIEGTGEVSTTRLTTKSPYQDGSDLDNVLLDERVISVEGTIVANSAEMMYAQRKLFESIFNPKLKEGTLVYQNDAGMWKIKGLAEDGVKLKEKFDNSRKQAFNLTLVCSKPFWIDITENKNEIAMWVGDFNFPLEMSADGLEIGHRESSLIVNINNLGDVECGIKIEFTALASVVNPSIYNVNTQEYLKVKRTLQSGDKLVINTEFANKSVDLIRNGLTTNVFNYIDLNSTFLQLDVGDNLLRYDAESGIDNLEVSIYNIPRYVGV